MSYFNNKVNWLIYIVISVVFIILNISTFDHRLPWNDEVELTETVLNFVDQGEWISKAFPSYGGCPPFSMYVPLPQFLQAGWMLIFGNSMISARSFNLFVVFIIGIIIIRLIKTIINKEIKWYVVLLLSFLLWGGNEFANIYRNGRGDVVGIVFCLLIFDSILKYLKYGEKRQLLLSCIWSALLTWSTLQSCALIFFSMICALIVYKESRLKLFKVGAYILLGFVIGFILVVGYFSLNNHFLAFVHTIVGLSASLKKIAISLLPFVGPYLGLDPDEWLAKANDDIMGIKSHQLKGALFITKFISYNILLVISILISLLNIRLTDVRINFKRNAVLNLILFSLLVPLFMILAGRYVEYYWWMSYIPIIMAVSILAQNISNRYLKTIIFISILVVTTKGISSLYNKEMKEKYIEIKELCKRLPIQRDDVVSAPDLLLYEIRKKSDNCYFTRHYEIKYLDLKTVNYYIEYAPDIDRKSSSKQSRQFDDAIKSDNTIKLEIIDRSELLDLTVYRVHHVN